MKRSMIALNTLLLAGSALAADDALRAKLIGKWRQSGGNGETWTLKDSGGSMRLTTHFKRADQP
jgi:hypothetical protein